MDIAFENGIWVLNINMIQSLALAVVTYYLGVWVKTKVAILERLSMPSPVVGGMILAVILSILQGCGILLVHFDSTLPGRQMRYLPQRSCAEIQGRTRQLA